MAKRVKHFHTRLRTHPIGYFNEMNILWSRPVHDLHESLAIKGGPVASSRRSQYKSDNNSIDIMAVHTALIL